MQIKVTETKPVTSEVIKDYICNQCGESCLKTLGGTDLKEFYGTGILISGGYESTHIGDGICYSFELCEKCVAEIIKGLKIPPTVTYDE